jgi:Fe-S cluster biogenesis protein NfuA
LAEPGISDLAQRSGFSGHDKKKEEPIMKERVQESINKIRPMLQADGGDVELVDIEDGVVKVRLQGACAGCPMSQMTLKNGIEKFLKQEIPEVVSVESAD